MTTTNLHLNTFRECREPAVLLMVVYVVVVVAAAVLKTMLQSQWVYKLILVLQWRSMFLKNKIII